jgi:glycine/D-amino acid oxidase-like deaminating enzyme
MAVVEEPAGPQNPNGIAGVMDVEAVMRMLQAKLERRGVEFRYGEGVTLLKESENDVEIRTPNTVIRSDHAILAPGQWLEQIVDDKGRSITRNHHIQPRYDRVVVADIDFHALKRPTQGIPFTKGFAPPGGDGTFYSHEADSKNGRVKYFAKTSTRSVESVAALQRPVSEEEKEVALKAASIRFGIDEKELAKHTLFSTCAYVSPKIGEKPLVAALGKHLTFIGLDSSGMARTSAGMGKIAASLAMGRQEPHPGAYDAFGLAAHYKQVGVHVIDCGACTSKEACPVPQRRSVAR